MKKSFGLVLGMGFIFLSLFSLGYSEDNIEYLYFDINTGTEDNIVSYRILIEDFKGSVLKVGVSYQGSKIDEICEIPAAGEDIKRSCPIPDKGDGLYVFDARLYSPNGDLIDSSVVEEYLFEGSSARYEFEILEDKTLVNLVIGGEGDGLVILNNISKDVIAYLDENNKDDLITSEFDYEIIEADPLIAWNVEEVPSSINYTINKRVDEADLKNFDIEVAKQSPSFILVKFAVLALLIIIIAFIFRPVFAKKK